MKALTISQPFATLIADGEKWVENRTWYTNYRGPLAIHAGKGNQYLHSSERHKYKRGGVVATSKLVGCVRLADCTEPRMHERMGLLLGSFNVDIIEFLDHEHTEGPFCWILQDVKAIDFVPCKGAQGLWDWNEPAMLKHGLREEWKEGDG